MHKAKCARGHAVTVAVVSYNLSSVTYIVDAIVDDVFVVLLLASFLSPIGRQHQIFMLAFLSLCPYLLLSSLLLLWRVFCFCHCGNLRSMLVLLSLGSVSVIGLFNTCCYLVICVNGRRTRIYRRDAVLLIYPWLATFLASKRAPASDTSHQLSFIININYLIVIIVVVVVTSILTFNQPSASTFIHVLVVSFVVVVVVAALPLLLLLSSLLFTLLRC